MADKKSILERLGIVEVVPVEEEKKDGPNLVPFADEPAVQEMPVDETPEPIKEEPAETPKYEDNGSSLEVNLDKFTNVDEIYHRYSLDKNQQESVYIIDEYAKALPSNLPNDMKKQSVINIVKVSGLNLEELKRDGHDRINSLEKHMDKFSRRTDEVIHVCEHEIDDLEKKIASYKRMIADRQGLQEKQRMACEFEKNRIGEILDFAE